MGRPMDKLIIARGVFDDHWQFSENFTQTGDPEIRKNCPRTRVLPDLTTVVDNLPEVDLSVYKTMTGKYINQGVIVELYLEGDVLMAKLPNNSGTIKLYPSSETEYFTDAGDLQIVFFKDESGNIEYLIAYDSPQEYKLIKMK